MYLAASSGLDVLPAQLPVTMAMAGPSCGLQQGYVNSSNSSSIAGPYSVGMSGAAYTAPLPMSMQSSYLQRQQMVMCQQGERHAGFYSDPLPYLANVSMPAMAIPATQQQQQQQQAQQQLLFAGQGLPASMPLEQTALGYAPAAAGPGEGGLTQAQLLMQKQQALQQLQAVEQMMLLRLLPDA
jgi:hypothetical protein